MQCSRSKGININLCNNKQNFNYYFLEHSSFLGSLCFDCYCRLSTCLYWIAHKWCSSLNSYRLIYNKPVLYMSSSISPFQHILPCICQHWFWSVKVLPGWLGLLVPLAPLRLSRIIYIICWSAMELAAVFTVSEALVYVYTNMHQHKRGEPGA